MGVKPNQKNIFRLPRIHCMESVGCIAMEEFNFQHIHEYFMLQQDFSSPLLLPCLVLYCMYIYSMFSWQCIYTPLVLSSLILRLFPFILIFLCFILLLCIILPCAILSCDFYVFHSVLYRV